MAVVTWPVVYVAGGDCPDLTAPNKTTMEALAIEYLWNWTGKRYGSSPVAVRPCLAGCHGSTFWGSLQYGRAQVSVACGMCSQRDTCSCATLSSVALPGPVSAITKVMLDGGILPVSAYAVYDDRFLIRTDGGAWPRCQDYALDTDAPGTWEVQYERGAPVPMGGQIAAGVLACEFAKAATNSSACKLPQRLQSITRQGVTVTLLDPFDGLEQGHTGIWLIDSWVSSVTRAPMGGSVRSVDVPLRARRRTGGL